MFDSEETDCWARHTAMCALRSVTRSISTEEDLDEDWCQNLTAASSLERGAVKNVVQ